MAQPGFWPQTLVDWAQVFSAVGTVGAVIVALLLARKPRPKLRGTAGVMLLVHGDGRKDRPEFFGIRITNIGATEAVVIMVGWRLNHWRRRRQVHAYQDLVDEHWLRNPKLPLRLQHGEQAQFSLPWHGQHNWLRQIEEQGGFFPERVKARGDLEALRVMVYTTVGPGVAIKPDKSALDQIWQVHERALVSAGST